MERLIVHFFNLTVFISVAYCFCSSDESSIVKYEEIKDLPNHPDILLIDVREPKELAEFGVIPTSINIPLGSLRETLSNKTNGDEFFKKYGREFPGPESQIIFYCRSGRRAHDAMEIACSLGYTKSRNYKGSWLDWAKREGLKAN